MSINGQNLDQLIVSYTNRFDALINFISLAKNLSRDPSQYEKCFTLTRNCLTQLQKISSVFDDSIRSKEIDEALLVHAYNIKERNISYTSNGKPFRYRARTIQAGDDLCHSFEGLNRVLKSSEKNVGAPINTFWYDWECFQSRFEQDQFDAEAIAQER
ncbi:MAG: hypothetical protein HW387_1299 [Parachlamydiales bacterium]|nr:hypothetical protein [Parachlamydiales bacterium]